MKRRLVLVDDGTLDTVFECTVCKRWERFSEVERDDDGVPTEDAFEEADNAHECDEETV